jgi:hypothetical protein
MTQRMIFKLLRPVVGILWFQLGHNVSITVFWRNILQNAGNGMIFGYTVFTPTGSDPAAIHSSVSVVVAKMDCTFLNMFSGCSCDLYEKLHINPVSL